MGIVLALLSIWLLSEEGDHGSHDEGQGAQSLSMFPHTSLWDTHAVGAWVHHWNRLQHPGSYNRL